MTTEANAVMPVLATRRSRRPTLNQYLTRRLGTGSVTMLKTWVLRSFGAPSFAEFWRYWNPVYGYFLYYYAYRPLRRFVPRSVAMWLTFIACGFFLHDALGWTLSRHVRFPEMTLRFVLFGAGAVASKVLGMNLSRWPLPLRVLANGAYLVTAWWAASLLESLAT